MNQDILGLTGKRWEVKILSANLAMGLAEKIREHLESSWTILPETFKVHGSLLIVWAIKEKKENAKS